jgi:hypothetical protein
MGSLGVRGVVAVCGVLALSAACSSGGKHVSATPPTTGAPDESSVTISSTKAPKKAVSSHAKKSSSTKSTTSGSTARPATGSNPSSNTNATVAPTGSTPSATTGSSNTSSQFVVGPIGTSKTTTPTTVKPFDATKPVDLSGMPGVTAAEQARAEALLINTMRDLPKYANPEAAKAAGFRSIHDHIPGITNDEHYVNWSYLDDGRILDSRYPESLVYEVRNGKQVAVAAMYSLPFGSSFADVPDVGGALTQWHVHNNLCLIADPNDPSAKVIYGLVQPDQPCPTGSEKASVPMLHVWIVSNPCGPFSALEGIGAGQIPDGETRLCDTLHGST